MENLQEFYNGFFITEPIGNNAFSYKERDHKRIFVPSLIEGGLDDLAVGEEIVFSERSEEEEYNKKGLKHFIYIDKGVKDIFIFDNHNHAFFFWMWALKSGKLKKGLPLVHVDQHSDFSEPEVQFCSESLDMIDLERVFKYTNEVLTVGNFVKPALDLNIFSRVERVDEELTLKNNFDEKIILDVDIDIFAQELTFREYDFYIERIQSYIKAASFLTIATSPYFVDQEKAIGIVKELLDGV